MGLANKLTLLRIILAPVFYIVFMYLLRTLHFVWAIPLLWFIFIASQITDLLDGMAARKYNETSDFGKLFDPFADTLMQLTCFLCFVLENIFPPFFFLLVIYREFSILFLRNAMLKKGITMGARLSGKLKTVTYIIAGGIALAAASLKLLATSVERLPVFAILYPYFRFSAVIIFIVSVIISVISFFDYLSVYRRADREI